MGHTLLNRAHLWPMATGVVVGFLPVVVAFFFAAFTGRFPTSLQPELLSAPGLFVLESLFGYHVPTAETHWETLQIFRRWFVLGFVNATLWAILLLTTTTIAKWLLRPSRGRAS